MTAVHCVLVLCSDSLEAEVMQFRMQNSDSVKELEVVRKKSQAVQESLQKKGYWRTRAHTHTHTHTKCTFVTHMLFVGTCTLL